MTIILEFQIFFNATLILNGKLDEVVYGSLIQKGEQTDGLFNNEFTSKFNRSIGDNFGTDLIAIDIQRPRDQGIAGM